MRNPPKYNVNSDGQKEEDAILEYYKTRTHQVIVLTDEVNNSTKIEEICVIYHSEFEQEEIIGTLRCRHKYHVDCIK